MEKEKKEKRVKKQKESKNHTKLKKVGEDKTYVQSVC